MLNDFGKSLFKPWVSVANVSLALALIYLVFLAIRTYDLNKVEVASWVQAVGSIASIWGAFLLFSFGNRQREKEVGENQSRLNKIARLVVENSISRIHGFVKVSRHPEFNLPLQQAIVRDIREAKSNLDFVLNMNGVGVELFAILFSVRSELESTLFLLENWSAMVESDSEKVFVQLESCAKRADAVFRQIQNVT
ncbi:hypothetical protein [Pseudomonas putida]|uniref:hypothetical protein n=1 Tax=Pseudomonas putida TaxID=303 RepID=UPI001E420234|nr:hypothetical protein [Pseudomonas putida]MCE0880728.1 hypothetical protein [Pseudomonas putida]